MPDSKLEPPREKRGSWQRIWAARSSVICLIYVFTTPDGIREAAIIAAGFVSSIAEWLFKVVAILAGGAALYIMAAFVFGLVWNFLKDIRTHLGGK